jgi:hypothetical protein
MSTKAQSAQIQNGVNVDQLVGTVNAIKGTPSLAKFNFRSTSRWGGGAKSTNSIKSFYGAGQEDSSRKETFNLDGDEPAVLLGTNTAPNAVEAVLSALAGEAEPEQPEPEGAREIYSAKIIFAIARQAQADGDLVKAEVLVRQMMATHDKKVWPEEAEEIRIPDDRGIAGQIAHDIRRPVHPPEHLDDFR